MPRLSGISQRDAVRVFQKIGYHIARESCHIIISNGQIRLVIPRHNPINAITMGGIAKAAGADAGTIPRIDMKECWPQPSQGRES